MGYMIRHWRGQFGILHSFILNAVIPYVAIVYALVWLQPDMVIGIALFALFFIWAAVGTIRSCLHALRSWRSNAAGALSATLVLAVVVLVCFLAVEDVWRLVGTSRRIGLQQ